MLDFYIDFDELIKHLTIKRAETLPWRFQAFMGEDLIGELDALRGDETSPEFLKWRETVHYSLAKRSATVFLQTADGLLFKHVLRGGERRTRRVERKMRYPRISVMPQQSDRFDVAKTFIWPGMRKYVWRNRQTNEGFNILDEVMEGE